MVIYKAPVSAASNAHGASLHNNQNNITSYEPINRQKNYIQRCGKSKCNSKTIQVQANASKYKYASSFLKSMQRVRKFH